MLIDLNHCSFQHLRQIFQPLEEFSEYVFWLRNHDTSKQYYCTRSMDRIWDRDLDVLYELPLLFIDYLAKDENHTHFRQFQARHENYYLKSDTNLVLYQISTPSGELRYLLDRCYRCYCPQGQHYTLGISKCLTPEQWYGFKLSPPVEMDQESLDVHQLYFDILQNEFGIVPFKSELINIIKSEAILKNLVLFQKCNFTNREMECLKHICAGKSYKQMAREMTISPRTVETHVENILNKTACDNKISIISRFSKYFVD